MNSVPLLVFLACFNFLVAFVGGFNALSVVNIVVGVAILIVAFMVRYNED